MVKMSKIITHMYDKENSSIVDISKKVDYPPIAVYRYFVLIVLDVKADFAHVKWPWLEGEAK